MGTVPHIAAGGYCGTALGFLSRWMLSVCTSGCAQVGTKARAGVPPGERGQQVLAVFADVLVSQGFGCQHCQPECPGVEENVLREPTCAPLCAAGAQSLQLWSSAAPRPQQLPGAKALSLTGLSSLTPTHWAWLFFPVTLSCELSKLWEPRAAHLPPPHTPIHPSCCLESDSSALVCEMLMVKQHLRVKRENGREGRGQRSCWD